MTIAQVLARAAKLVERGWCQHTYRLHGKRCALTALQDAMGATDDLLALNSDSYRFAMQFIRPPCGLVAWNDSRDRTAPEVACWLSSASEFAKVLGR